MSDGIALDAAWRAAHPLPDADEVIDKNDRGRALVVGGGAFVPGAIGLSGEAALRAGAGKVQIATIDAAAIHLGVLLPEAAMIALPTDDDGEIGEHAAARLEDSARHCHALLIGPGMVSQSAARALVEGLLGTMGEDHVMVLDAAAISCLAPLADRIAACASRVIMTPHHGEMSKLIDVPADEIGQDPVGYARQAAERFQAVIVLKAADTVIAAPGEPPLLYASHCAGLATGGSGDVLAGIIAGLAARGADALTAAGWGVWLHGEAGHAAAERIGPIGFLARDLVREIPGAMAG